MARLLSLCLVAILVSAMLLECSALIKIKRRCCTRSYCVLGSIRCCPGYTCRMLGLIGHSRIGKCRRICLKGRDAEEDSEETETRELDNE